MNRRLAAGGRDVWFVDDNPTFRFMMNSLTSDTDYDGRTLFMDSGEKALDMLEEGFPTILFLDLHMQPVGGWEFLKKAKKIGYLGPVVLLTSLVTDDVKTRARLDSRVAEVLQKPLGKDAFVSVLKKIESHNTGP